MGHPVQCYLVVRINALNNNNLSFVANFLHISYAFPTISKFMSLPKDHVDIQKHLYLLLPWTPHLPALVGASDSDDPPHAATLCTGLAASR